MSDPEMVPNDAPNTGTTTTIEWEVPTTINVSNAYVLQVSATHDYRAVDKATVSIVHGDAEQNPGPIISPPKFAVTRALGEPVRIQWHPPAVESIGGSMSLVLIPDNELEYQEVVVIKKIMLSSAGTIMSALPIMPGTNQNVLVKLGLRSTTGDRHLL